MAATVFFYGSLRDADLLERLIGGPAPGFRPARVADARAVQVPGETYPMLIDAPGATAEGVLVSGLDTESWARIEGYEIGEYTVAEVQAAPLDALESPVTALCFRPKSSFVARLGGRSAEFETWRLDVWTREHKAGALAELDAVTPAFDSMGVNAAMRLWPDLVGAWPETPKRGLPSGPDVGAMSIDAREAAFEGYFRVDRVTARHAGFGGGEVGPLSREVFRSGPAVTILPFDPRAHLVALIEHWRAGPALSGDPHPWVIEVAAGRLEPGEDPEEAARRETLEETGLKLGRVEKISAFYSSSGAHDEFVTAFVGEARLDNVVDRVGGLDDEHEDIRCFVTPLETALIAAAQGEIRTGPTLLSLYWLDRHRDRLAALWRDD